MVCASVYMSGAGMSRCGPRYSAIRLTYLRVNRSSSCLLIFLVSTYYAAFRAAEGDVGDGAFPSHQHSQRRDFVEGDGWAIADAAFEGSACIPMLHPHAVENAYDAVVDAYVDADADGNRRTTTIGNSLRAISSPINARVQCRWCRLSG